MRLIEIGGRKFPEKHLKKWCPTVDTAMFMARLFDFSAQERSALLYALFGEHDLVRALTAEGGIHSNELQDVYLEAGLEHMIEAGELKLEDAPIPNGQVLPQVLESIQVQVAKAIQDVADQIGKVVHSLPGKEGAMVFDYLRVMNAKRPTIGDYKAKVKHANQLPNLLVFDTSGSVDEPTVRTLTPDVVALGYNANLHLAIVSDTATYWKPGEYSVETVLNAAQFGGTRYDELAPLMDRHWGTVITLADYDSYNDARSVIAQCSGSIEQILDISLVSRPTFLSECLGQIAKDVRPIMVADSDYTLARY